MRYRYPGKEEVQKFDNPIDLVCDASTTNDHVNGAEMKTHVDIFPNPTTEQLSILMPESTAASIKIINMDSRVIAIKSLTGSGILNVSDIASGLYIVHIQIDDATIARKIVIREYSWFFSILCVKI